MRSFLKQISNLIRLVGDEVSYSGRPVRHFPINEHPEQIGALDQGEAFRLTRDLLDEGLLRSEGGHAGYDPNSSPDGPWYGNVSLSAKGWEQYEFEKRNRVVQLTIIWWKPTLAVLTTLSVLVSAIVAVLAWNS